MHILTAFQYNIDSMLNMLLKHNKTALHKWNRAFDNLSVLFCGMRCTS